MNTSRKRVLTWTLVALGAAIIALGAVLALTFPWGQWEQQAGAIHHGFYGPWAAPWHGSYGYPFAWGGPGSWFFGRGVLAILVVVLIVVLAVRMLRRPWRSDRGYRSDEALDAEEILRREFAAGRITEEELRRRRDALRK